jgi:pantetheine-phosphate adenylyltransferase
MTTAVYAGSFDPITLGHKDIIIRARMIFDVVIIAVGYNPAKKTLFSVNERIDLINKSIGNGVEVLPFEGLLVDFCQKHQASVIVRGLRAVTDFEYELGLAAVNRTQNAAIETVFFPTHHELSFTSSSTVKEIARLNGKLSPYVSPHVEKALKLKFK